MFWKAFSPQEFSNVSCLEVWSPAPCLSWMRMCHQKQRLLRSLSLMQEASLRSEKRPGSPKIPRLLEVFAGSFLCGCHTWAWARAEMGAFTFGVLWSVGFPKLWRHAFTVLKMRCDVSESWWSRGPARMDRMRRLWGFFLGGIHRKKVWQKAIGLKEVGRYNRLTEVWRILKEDSCESSSVVCSLQMSEGEWWHHDVPQRSQGW